MQVDVLALQETNVFHGECRLSKIVEFHSMSSQWNRRSRASVFVRLTRTRVPVDLSAHCTDDAAFVGMTISMCGHLNTVVSAYVRPGVPWDSEVLKDLKIPFDR